MDLQKAYDLLHRGTIALAAVEANGLYIDVPYCKAAIERINRKISHYTARLMETDECKAWKAKYGRSMNLNSGDQLADMLYNEFGHTPKLFTDGNPPKPSTSEEALEILDGEFVELYFKIKKYEKAKGTYLEGTLAEVVDGFVHPSFDLNRAKSYRSSSSAINFQNIPIRNKEIGPLVRKMFIPREPNRHIVEIDYAAIEVRIGACGHKDPTMIKYIEDKSTDMHRDVAMDCYLLSMDEVTKDTRQEAKSGFTFSQAYGGYYPDCARHLWEYAIRNKLTTADGVPIIDHLATKGIKELGKCNKVDKPVAGTFEHHIQKVEQHFWNVRFPVYNQWRKELYSNYQKNGYFDSLMGFRFSGYFRRNEVINFGTQCVAFQCLLWSLVEIQDAMRHSRMRSCIIGQIHDSIIGDIYEDELDDYLALAFEIMTNKLRNTFSFIIVPIEAEADVAPVGMSWDAKEKHSKFSSY